MQKSSAAYGKGEVDAADVELVTASALLEMFRAPDYQPPVLPVIAIELHALVQRPLCDFKQVMKLIERDPLVASKVLRAAQSPLYATGVPVHSLADALQRLGLATISQIVFEVTVGMTLFRARGFEAPMERVRKHSSACAYVARAVAHATNQPRELAFMCGLLHDVGIVGCLLALSRPRGGTAPDFATMWPIVDGLHGEVGEHLARLWLLPEAVQQVIAWHHAGARPDGPGSGIEPLARVVYIADAIVSQLGLGIEQAPHPDELAAAYRFAGLDGRLLPELHAYASTVVTQVA